MALQLEEDDKDEGEEPSLFPTSRNTGEGLGTKKNTDDVINYIENKTNIFIKPSDFSSTDADTAGNNFFNALNMDKDVNEGASGATFVIPNNWDGQQLIFTVLWSSAFSGSGNVFWQLEIQWAGEEDPLGQPADQTSGTSLTDTKTSTDKLQKISWTTSGKDFKAGDIVGIQITRLADEGTDTLGSDASFLGIVVEVKE